MHTYLRHVKACNLFKGNTIHYHGGLYMIEKLTGYDHGNIIFKVEPLDDPSGPHKITLVATSTVALVG